MSWTVSFDAAAGGGRGAGVGDPAAWEAAASSAASAASFAFFAATSCSALAMRPSRLRVSPRALSASGSVSDIGLLSKEAPAESATTASPSFNCRSPSSPGRSPPGVLSASGDIAVDNGLLSEGGPVGAPTEAAPRARTAAPSCNCRKPELALAIASASFIFLALAFSSDWFRSAFRRLYMLLVSFRTCASFPWCITCRMSSKPCFRRSSSTSDPTRSETVNDSSNEFFPAKLSIVSCFFPRPVLSAAASVVKQSRCAKSRNTASSPARRKARNTWNGVWRARRSPLRPTRSLTFLLHTIWSCSGTGTTLRISGQFPNGSFLSPGSIKYRLSSTPQA